ncbi:sigma factor-like helix-turn-helix DNA-binding protein [Pseudomonas sp. 5P_5.1_Bac1]|uniref:sigma factor-like helix-turn-helix DNA-binding protein n=1 Tax=Pseudomonas sp. 5P_5.1_Bac1 TaxID=2971616 RepID=UPI0021C6D704|nr:sigma factor-like helix-turn-helix DNA-binding protein [Pseudomonas sp. 5P_5.1_Bac1]MCU1724369.1 DUF4880 domain-containing protein [Pseudomonas sp. 5P_5.1_Bac1]
MTRLLLPLDHHAACADSTELALLHRLKKLPRRVQQVFLLNRLDQLSYADIARRLDLSDASVERHMKQVLQCTLPAPSAIARSAGEWYVRLQSPQVTASERIDFRRWLDAAPEHLAAFHATELRWRTLLAPARLLGENQWYRQGRAAFSLGGCTVAMGLGVAALLALGFWS